MKTNLIILAGVLFSGVSWGQTTGTPQVPSGQAQFVATNEPGSGEGALTNQTVLSSTATNLSQLAPELENLRTAVTQTLPLLTAFNERYATSGQGWSGKLSGLVSGALNRNTAQTPQTSGTELSNVLSALGGLVHTGSQQGPSVDPRTLQNLATLQRDLQPVMRDLQNLNLATTNQVSQPAGTLTPTGR